MGLFSPITKLGGVVKAVKTGKVSQVYKAVKKTDPVTSSVDKMYSKLFKPSEVARHTATDKSSKGVTASKVSKGAVSKAAKLAKAKAAGH